MEAVEGIIFDISVQDKLHEAIINLSRHNVESNVRLGPEHHAPADNTEIAAVEEAVFNDAGVQAELKKLGLPKETKFICDPWIYGALPYSHINLDRPTDIPRF